MNRLCFACCIAAGTLLAFSESAAQDVVVRTVSASGGIQAYDGSGRVVEGTLGQPVVGHVSTSSARTSLGFWNPERNAANVANEGGATTGPNRSSHVEFTSGGNPFSESTELQVYVPTASAVTVTLYDGLGRTVRTLLDGETLQGTTTLVVEADGLASGTYTAVMTAGAERSALHLVLAR